MWLCVAVCVWLGCARAAGPGEGAPRCAGGGARLLCRAARLTALPDQLPSHILVLDVSYNNISSVSQEALAPAQGLRLLEMSVNEVSALRADSFPDLPALHTLLLRKNRISYIDPLAFQNTPAIRVLRLEENLLLEVPAALNLLPLLEDLSVGHNLVSSLAPAALSAAPRLSRLDLRRNPLDRLPPELPDLPHLTTLILSEGRGLRWLPHIRHSPRLRSLRLDRARLSELPHDLCARAPLLRTLDLRLNQFTRLPDLRHCTELRVLDLSSNLISSLSPEDEIEEVFDETGEIIEAGSAGSALAAGGGGSLAGLSRLHDLLLARNRLRRVTRRAFRHTPALQLLDLEDNEIEHIDMEAFVPISKLEDLNVGNNMFPVLPAAGLSRLRVLKAHNNPRLRNFHPPHAFPHIQTLVLSYAYHCCEFLPLMEATLDDEDDDEEGGLSDLVLVPRGNNTDLWQQYLNASGGGLQALGGRGTRRLTCRPLPGPFLPCEDLFDWWTLRCGVWAVFLLALLGNGTVVFVLLWSRARLDVPRFLVTNLAAADLCMGVYLGLLAVVDAGTLGEFRAHALRWQLSPACRLAGFLAVLSSELSVYTLAVITLERNYAITHAMHLNKRLSLRHAAGVMAAGWVLSGAAAALPLLGVSDYRRVAVCLPFEAATPGSRSYVLALLAANGLAFLVLLGCYLKMYCAIRGSQAWNSNDSRIAKRMALLVFTDFLCWAPVAICALAAVSGARLVSLELAKVLTVFVLPLNSCCNPFLYAILTKQFKKDCALVCKSIEESRVTRGIGRCRHSSNFSNRQTPANTNSLAERSSRGGECVCRREARRAPLLARWLRAVRPPPPPPRPPPKPHPRAGSVSSSVEFSSSRSDSWRAYGGRAPPPRRAASWLVARKTSQDSNLSSSRNDSSGSNATASTGTWRTPRRPRLTRQPALDEPPAPPALPALHTIPSAAEPDLPTDDQR